MQTIHDFPFNLESSFTIAMPRGARIIHVASRDDRPCIWAIVRTDTTLESRRFRLFRTGQKLARESSDPLVHVRTFMKDRLVWHLFEAVPDDE